MTTQLRILRQDANQEILARIIKATARKYQCSVKIDFSDGRCCAQFIGDNTLKPHIVKEVEDILNRARRPEGTVPESPANARRLV
jgi:hypothetical protein